MIRLYSFNIGRLDVLSLEVWKFAHLNFVEVSSSIAFSVIHSSEFAYWLLFKFAWVINSLLWCAFWSVLLWFIVFFPFLFLNYLVTTQILDQGCILDLWLGFLELMLPSAWSALSIRIIIWSFLNVFGIRSVAWWWMNFNSWLSNLELHFVLVWIECILMQICLWRLKPWWFGINLINWSLLELMMHFISDMSVDNRSNLLIYFYLL